MEHWITAATATSMHGMVACRCGWSVHEGSMWHAEAAFRKHRKDQEQQ